MVPKRFATITVSLLFAAFFLVSSPTPVSATEDDPHSFECGTDEAPSGPYLDFDLMQIFDYDCTTGLLTAGELASSGCERVYYGRLIPIAGLCAWVEGDGSTASTYNARWFVAVVGKYENGEGMADRHDTGDRIVLCGNYWDKCQPSYVQGIGFGIGLTYGSAGYDGSVDCSGTGFSIGSHYEVWGTDGTLSGQHHQNALVCH